MDFSETLIPVKQDIYIIPAELIPDLPVKIIEIDNRLPVIAYGSRFHLKNAFAAGCYDYVKEPWEPEELFLRLERMIAELNEKSFLDEILNKASENDVCFSYQEITILKNLIKQSGRLLERELLLQLLWQDKLPDKRTRVIDVHISNIRKKLKTLGISKQIKSVRGTGYILED